MTKTRICRIAAWTCNNWHDPCNTIYAENHAYDHNKIVNIELNSKYFNVAESACLQCMSSASDWSNSTCQPFLTSNWHFWQMVQMSAQCLLCKTEKAQISGQMQIICTGWHLCYVRSLHGPCQQIVSISIFVWLFNLSSLIRAYVRHLDLVEWNALIIFPSAIHV